MPILTGFNNDKNHGKILMEELKALTQKNDDFFAKVATMDPNYPATAEIAAFGKQQKTPNVVVMTTPEVDTYKETQGLINKAEANPAFNLDTPKQTNTTKPGQ